MPELAPDWPQTAFAGKIRRRRPWRRWDRARKEQLTRLWLEKVPTKQIADEMETSPGAIYIAAAKMGLPTRNLGKGTRKRRKKTPKPDSTGNRRFEGVVSNKGPKIVLESHHPASRKATTFFPSTVKPAATVERILKSGHNSRKIGDKVGKGKWRGIPIFTLTLEERDTCPRSCLEWTTCYGNNMPFAHRIHDDGTLTKRIWAELAALNAAHPAGFLVRLHVLGDFYSIAYVEFWRLALVEFRALRIFGFTARKASEPIGMAILRTLVEHQDRFWMRFSGGGYETHCSEVVERPEDVSGVRCPAETDAARCCATCALCWTSDRTISFVRH